MIALSSNATQQGVISSLGELQAKVVLVERMMETSLELDKERENELRIEEDFQHHEAVQPQQVQRRSFRTNRTPCTTLISLCPAMKLNVHQ